MNFKKRSKIKAALFSVAALATSCLIGMSACAKSSTNTEEEEKKETKQDIQPIKNGNFEFYDDNDGLYPISDPDSWSIGSNGSSSSSKSGVIKTDKKGWDYITDKTLPQTLEDNDNLKSDDENKKDYNSVLKIDLPYENTHNATKSEPSTQDLAYIQNPFTHKYKYDENGNVTDTEGDSITTYEKDGKVYTDAEHTKELDTSVLMLHNYRSSYYMGTETYATSSSTITLEARTAAKLSVWVKTAELYFDGSKAERTPVVNEHGAYIKVDTTVAGNSLDAFYIRNIDTQTLNPDGDNNGWVEFNVYIQSSSFAQTTVEVTLGLGENERYTVEGYAFFDDVTIDIYESAAEMIETVDREKGVGYFNNHTEKSTSSPLAPDNNPVFRVDTVTFKTNNDKGEITLPYNSADRDFYIDFASSHNVGTADIELNSLSVSAGFTVENTSNGKYVCSKNTDLTRYGIKTLNGDLEKYYLPSTTFNSIKVSNDILATTTIGGDNWSFNIQGHSGKYDEVMTKALKSASTLPAVKDGKTTALVMLSADGAAYEAELTNEAFKLAPDEHALLTFWIKTHDMDGKTAATVTVKDADENNDKSSDFTIDSTTVDPVEIKDNKDMYDGWVECFIRIENSSDTDKEFKIGINFGNTTIKGKSETDFIAGWVAVANASIMKLDKDVYSYTSGLSNSASLTLSDDKKDVNAKFDTELGDRNKIKEDLAIPANYTGVNGGSAEVKSLHVPATEYDQTNRNPYAGLLNKEYLDNYKEGCEWYSAIEALKNINDNETIWNTLAGRFAVQPLLIVNAEREFNNEKAVYNYGYIGNKSSVSSNGYTAVSVRVKVSEGAIANVYLIDASSADKQVLSYKTPAYTFWYDDNGNILKGEPAEKPSVAQLKENIAYTLRKDGLYENGDGKLYANFYNLKKYYDYDLSKETFYDSEGEIVKFEDIIQGETYYANAQRTAYAPHYLIAGNENNKIYKYNAGLASENNLTYYYMVSGKADTSKTVYGIDTSVAPLRYDNTSSQNDCLYQFTIDATKEEGKKYIDKWVTVTFYIHAGNLAKDYKLELWSGYRDEKTSGQSKNSYVMFDYDSFSLDQSSFDNMVEHYTDSIIDAYKSEISDEQKELSENITDYEKLAGKKLDVYGYQARYYTYTLYDSANYVPFNADTANENETGYAYNYSDYSESLAFLKVEDKEGDEYVMSAFIDYSALDKEIDVAKVSDSDHDHSSDSDSSSSSTKNGSNFWLLLASIILLAAIVLAMLVMLIRYLVKKFRRNTTAGRNTYNFNKNKRYVRKYVKANGEVAKVEEKDVDESLLTDKEPEAPAEETPAEETPVEEAPVDETPVEETPAENAPVEETPVEETPVEETPTEETPVEKGDDENKE